jgi:hypothetical protein
MKYRVRLETKGTEIYYLEAKDEKEVSQMWQDGSLPSVTWGETHSVLHIEELDETSGAWWRSLWDWLKPSRWVSAQ